MWAQHVCSRAHAEPLPTGAAATGRDRKCVDPGVIVTKCLTTVAKHSGFGSGSYAWTEGSHAAACYYLDSGAEYIHATFQSVSGRLLVFDRPFLKVCTCRGECSVSLNFGSFTLGMASWTFLKMIILTKKLPLNTQSTKVPLQVGKQVQKQQLYTFGHEWNRAWIRTIGKTWGVTTMSIQIAPVNKVYWQSRIFCMNIKKILAFCSFTSN